MSDLGILTRFCPSCGQAMSFPTSNLSLTFACPRCGATHQAGNFVDRQQALPVVFHAGAQMPPQPPPVPWSGAAPNPPGMHPPMGAAAPAIAPEQAPQSATPSALRSAPDALVAAGAQAAGAGLRMAGKSTSLVLDFADWVDGKLQGKRVTLLGIASFVGVGVQLVGEQEDKEILGAIAMVFFVGVLSTALLGFIARCRDEETKRFSFGLATERVGAVLRLLPEVGADLREAPTPIKLQQIGKILAFLGFFAAEALIVSARLDLYYGKPAWVVVALWVTALALLLWKCGDYLEAGQGTSSTRAPAARGVRETVSKLGDLVDAGQQIPPTYNPLVDALLQTLNEWRPGTGRSEREYHDRLFHLLRRRHAMVLVSSEKRVQDRYGGFRRVDLVLEGFGERLLLELKAKYGRGDIDRAAQQVRAYVELDQGPVGLVLCGADAQTRNLQELLGSVRAQRGQGLPVFAVLPKLNGQAFKTAPDQARAEVDAGTAQGTKRVVYGFVGTGLLLSAFALPLTTNPPHGLLPHRHVERPAAVAYQAPTISAAQPLPEQPTTCRAFSASSFHLRPYETISSIGPEYPQGTDITVISRTNMVRRGNTLYRVRLPDGAVGYVFLGANEFVGGCGL